jgi:uncharacterized protein with ATP-grasp and redox domains
MHEFLYLSAESESVSSAPDGYLINEGVFEFTDLSSTFSSESKEIGAKSSIPGTDIRYCSEDFLRVIRESDLILAKGMGNFETLSGGDVSAYYLFICKCKRLAELLQKPLYTGVLYKELP